MEKDIYRTFSWHVAFIYEEMKYIPEYFEQVITLFSDVYDETNQEHKRVFLHLCKRFGLLIATLNRLVVMTQNRETSLNWFCGKMVAYDAVPQTTISLSFTKELRSEKKLIDLLTLVFAAICDSNDDNYMSSLIACVEALFEWYPLKYEACEYAMVEMMKSVAMKEMSLENANAFMEFFERLPRFYEVLSFERIMELKSKINHTLADAKPLENKIFNTKGVKNRLILLNYKIDMEDLYYEGLATK